MNMSNLLTLPESANATSALIDRPTYGFINSRTIAERFQLKGWEVAGATQAGVRKPAKQGYQRHVIRFRNESLGLVNGMYPELVLKNSHDGSSSFELMLGFFRIACANGLIVGKTIDSIRVIHSKNAMIKLDDAIERMVARIPDAIAQVQAMQGKTLTRDQEVKLAKLATDTRLKNVKNIVDVNLHSVLTVNRVEDRNNDLFTVFNRIQERMIKGGFFYDQEVFTNKTNYVRHCKALPIRSVKQSVDINRVLWDQAMVMAA